MATMIAHAVDYTRTREKKIVRNKFVAYCDCGKRYLAGSVGAEAKVKRHAIL